MTKRRRILLLIPVVIIACTLLSCWITFIVKGYTIRWQNLTAVIAFIPVVYLASRKQDYTKALLATGIYLLLGTCTLLSLLPGISRATFGVSGVSVTMDPISLFLLVIYLALNTGALMDVYLDYKEKKHEQSKNSNRSI